MLTREDEIDVHALRRQVSDDLRDRPTPGKRPQDHPRLRGGGPRGGKAAALARVQALPESPIRAQGAPRDYQIQVYGPQERIVDLPGGSRAHIDGITTEYGGIIGDAKLVTSPQSSFYIPDSLSGGLGEVAEYRMDRVVLRLADASDAFGGQRAIEIVTNNVESARAWEARMSALDVPGYVRIQP